MGTNYYVVPNKPSVIEPVHIGKSSMGWKFLFHEVNEPYRDIPIIWHTYEQVKAWLYRYTVEKTDYVIMNEYDEIIPYANFIDLVERKQIQADDNPDNFTYCKDVNGYRFTEGEFC